MKPIEIKPKILSDMEKEEINKMFGINISEDLSLFKTDFETTRTHNRQAELDFETIPKHIRQIKAKALKKLKLGDDLPDDIA
ncbi:MAG: hypothetical protein GY749_48395 [Desulfobacteraceae bacterium]|nr:hypothetical protein [Desulfobacteraceae bacterium]